ncbi:MAG: hypothetical protein EOO07_21735 [Chitinophagaceae bacterium]|nr:MAG: hypothetical protein EOO07_21735 [Chitinophagaceae bacterium]
MSTYVITPTAEQEKVVKAFLEALNISFEKNDEEVLPEHVLKGIAKGLEDVEAGRTITMDEFKKRLASR